MNGVMPHTKKLSTGMMNFQFVVKEKPNLFMVGRHSGCLLYTSDAADELRSV